MTASFGIFAGAVDRPVGAGTNSSEFASAENAMERMTVSFGIFSGAVGRPAGAKQINPGQSAAPPRVVVAMGPQALKGRHKPMHGLSHPLFATMIRYVNCLALSGLIRRYDRLPRAAATLAKLASPCPGLICRAPSG